MSNGEALSLGKGRIMRLVRKVERLQSIIDKKRATNIKRDLKYTKRVMELERKRDRLFMMLKDIKRDFYYKVVNHVLNSHEYVVVENLDLKELRGHVGEKKVASRKVHKYLRYIALSEFYHILEWKAELYVRKIMGKSRAYEQGLFKVWLCEPRFEVER